MTIPFRKPCLDDDDIDAVVETLKRGWIAAGPAVRRFESAFAEYVGAKDAMVVNSCTAAKRLALAGLGLGADP
jgi:dTDP-4-amino-4,6-dideoxygalactose transaminase